MARTVGLKIPEAAVPEKKPDEQTEKEPEKKPKKK